MLENCILCMTVYVCVCVCVYIYVYINIYLVKAMDHNRQSCGGDGIPVELFQILKEYAAKLLHSIWHQICKTQQWPEDWKWLVFISIPKKGNAKEGLNYCTIALISYAGKVMLKFSKPGFNSVWTVKFQMFKLHLESQRNQSSNCQHPLNHRKSEFQKKIYCCFIDYAKAFNCVDHNRLENS